MKKLIPLFLITLITTSCAKAKFDNLKANFNGKEINVHEISKEPTILTEENRIVTEIKRTCHRRSGSLFHHTRSYSCNYKKNVITGTYAYLATDVYGNKFLVNKRHGTVDLSTQYQL